MAVLYNTKITSKVQSDQSHYLFDKNENVFIMILLVQNFSFRLTE